MGYHELAVTAPALCPVKRVVSVVGGHEIFHVDSTAEPFESVIRAAIGLEVVYCSAVTHAVECEAVGLFLLGEGISAVLNADVLECTGVVVRVVSTVGSVTDLRLCISTGIDRSLAADMQTSPCACFLSAGSHYDG